ncbi:twin arginine translocase protein A [Streptomyces sp. ADI95-16]|uniref:Sec-independent protein translocase subunit TatA n=1 Tax=Streptomyces sp. ADI95-16 TaxID=1522758 RepID=UPI000F3A9075|nr:Sec-independent protein translocase subunit TatA [Streptomyces sp. ADI95-16]AYV32169.1 twin arginine translocase protein A [Streptomyces sp. ADI95-16]
MFGISEIAIILIIIVLVFGAKKLPELARSMGKSARILKSEARAMKGDSGTSEAPVAQPGTPPDSPVIKGTVTHTGQDTPGTTQH